MTGLIILYFICIILSISIIFLNRNKLNGFLFFNVGYSIYYFVIPFIILNVSSQKKEEFGSYLRFINEYNQSDLFVNFLRSAGIYFIFLFFYFFIFFRKKEIGERDTIEFIRSQNTNKILLVGIICLILGLISELVIIKNFGGVFNAISMAEKLRAYGVDRSNYMPQNLLFVNILSGISLAAPFIFRFIMISKKRMWLTTLYVISIVISCFYLLFFAGRLPIILFVSCFVFNFVFNKFKKPWLMIALFTVIMFVSVTLLEDFLFYLSYGYIKNNTNSGFLRQVNDFSFPYSNNLAAYKMNELFGYRYGIDLVTWIINIIPTNFLKIFGLTKVTSGYEYLTLYYDPQGVTLGGTPTDFVTLGIRQLPFIGPLLITILYSFICSVIDKAIDKINFKKLTFVKVRIASIMFIIVPYADYDSFFRNRFDMVIVLLLVIGIIKYPIKKESKSL